MQYILLGNNPSYTKARALAHKKGHSHHHKQNVSKCRLWIEGSLWEPPGIRCYLDSKVKTFSSKTRINSDSILLPSTIVKTQ